MYGSDFSDNHAGRGFQSKVGKILGSAGFGGEQANGSTSSSHPDKKKREPVKRSGPTSFGKQSDYVSCIVYNRYINIQYIYIYIYV